MHNVRQLYAVWWQAQQVETILFNCVFKTEEHVDEWEWRDRWRIEDRGGGNRDWEEIMYEIPPLSFFPRLPWPQDDFLNNHTESELSFCMRGATRPRNRGSLRAANKRSERTRDNVCERGRANSTWDEWIVKIGKCRAQRIHCGWGVYRLYVLSQIYWNDLFIILFVQH